MSETAIAESPLSGAEIIPCQVELGVITAYKAEMRKAREEAMFPRQERLAELAIDFCIDVLEKQRDFCICDSIQKLGDSTNKHHMETGNGKLARNATKLCRVCQRVRMALEIWRDVEKITVERTKIDAGLLKLVHGGRGSSGDDDESGLPPNLPEIVIRGFHEQRLKKLEAPKEMIVVDSNGNDQ